MNELLSPCRCWNVDEGVESNCKISTEVESDVKILVEKLENLLVKQQKELNDLKRRHEEAISDLLNDVSPEIAEQVLNFCKLNMPDYKEP